MSGWNRQRGKMRRTDWTSKDLLEEADELSGLNQRELQMLSDMMTHHERVGRLSCGQRSWLDQLLTTHDRPE